ncbi:MAG: ferrochelatase [Thermoplasmatales archaeon]|nr:ferrochelatase [Thermoplasmatales archaeon]MCW6171027.1 ferrochelatase [Thermoplasmatales archaeon]
MSSKYVVLMYYGFPENPDGLMDYLRDIFKGKEPPEFVVKENEKKIAMLGGTSPSIKIVRAIRDKVEDSLSRLLPDYKVVLIAKHVKPSINEAKEMIGNPEISVEVPLFPIYSSFIFSSYFGPFESSVRSERSIRVSDLSSNKPFQQHFINNINENFDTGDRKSLFIFTSHSVPINGYEPYPKNINDLASAICSATGIDRPFIVYHSRGPFGKNWLGPDFEYLRSFCRRNSIENVVAVPIGFIYDHLEVLYDLDIDLKGRLAQDGVSFQRVPLPNDSEATISSIVSSVLRNTAGNV